jgi:ribosomal protein L11 methyltransferase
MADDAAGIIVAHGALGCEVRNIPLPRPPLRKKKLVRLHAYFDRIQPAAFARIGATLRGAGMLANGPNPTIRQLEDPGWATMWRARFEPLPVGRRFMIVPPWRRAAARDRLKVVIRPGRAFGTGHHPSTFATLSLVEECCADRRIGRALDVGTGSGILAIAMRKLGITQVVAIDIDPTALENASENAELNGLAEGIRFSAAPLASIRGRFDLITANILSSVLIDMAQQLKARLRPGGSLILAGILRREAASVAAAYRPDLRLVRTQIDRAWTALMLQR